METGNSDQRNWPKRRTYSFWATWTYNRSLRLMFRQLAKPVIHLWRQKWETTNQSTFWPQVRTCRRLTFWPLLRMANQYIFLWSCSINWKNQLYIFGGATERRQISRLSGQKLERVGDLPFYNYYNYGKSIHIFTYSEAKPRDDKSVDFLAINWSMQFDGKSIHFLCFKIQLLILHPVDENYGIYTSH